MNLFYIYFIISSFIAFFLVFKSKTRYKVELFVFSFYLLTGHLNTLLTISIPGFGFFEIQPIRFIFLILTFFLIRKILFSKEKIVLTINGKIPFYELMLFAFMFFTVVSQIANRSHVANATIILNFLNVIIILVLIVSLQLMADKAAYKIIGKSIIIGAVFSSVVSIIQLTIAPFFLRIGDQRIAFGDILRSNGIFYTEYFNSYFLITAIAWALITIKNKTYKYSFLFLFSIGILSSFQRMSWLILILIIVIYLTFIERVAIEKLILAGLSCLAIILTIYILFNRDIMNSSLVKERLSESVDGRKGYYAMVIDNIHKKPLFGFGDLYNDVYYHNLLRITGNINRATAKEGDLHSGYFTSLFIFGIPGFILFTLFVVSSVIYFAKLYTENLFFAIPFIISIIYMFGNLTNNFLPLEYLSILYAIHIGIGMGMKQLNNRLPSSL